MDLKIKTCRFIDIPRIEDYRGNLAVIEKDVVPFKIERVYYLFDVPSGSVRGGHAHKNLSQFLIPLSGSFDVVLKDIHGHQQIITLNKPNKGLLIPNMVWREIEEFSSGAICLVVASETYNEDDYIRDFKQFLSS